MMKFKWFNAREAAEVGSALADWYVAAAARPSPARGSEGKRKERATALEQLHERADREVRPLELNFYQKARFANAFKWKLIDSGIEGTVANDVTQSVIVHLSRGPAAGVDLGSTGAQGAGPGNTRASALLAQANKSFAEGDFVQAAALFGEFVELVPRRADVLNTLGVALLELHRYQEAEQRYRQAIEIDPGFVEALCNLASVLQGDPQEAEEYLRRALRVNPKHAGARTILGRTLAFTGRQHEAKAAFRKALKIAPNQSDALLGLAQIERTEGRFDEAESLTKRVLKTNPKNPIAWAALNSTRKMTTADSDWIKGAEEIAASGVLLWEEAELRFAMGKYYDDVEDFSRAFQNYRRANELLKSVSQKYDTQSHSRFADNMIRTYSQQTLAKVGGGGSDSMKPILVVGMPRSGTSLVEQIIASHPAAKGAGEPDFWINTVRARISEVSQGILDDDARKKLAEEYLRVLERLCPGAERIVDKTLINSDYLGFIHSVLPNARIIRVQRDPIDTCLSCYFQHFSTAMRFSMDLDDLADYYRVNQRLMNHWCSALPAGSILEVPYEELVVDQEAWTRKILDFLGLEWDERCLSFHKTERSVNTASAWQVRQKIYTQSVGRWRKYEKFIGPLKELKN
jgi:tetratricopeptide (TPR) repeat protein